MSGSTAALKLHIEFKPLLSIVNVSLEFSKDVLTSTVQLTVEPQCIVIKDDIHNHVFQLKSVTLNPSSCRGLRWGSARELQFTLQVQPADKCNRDNIVNGHGAHVTNQDLLVSRIQASQSHCYCIGCGAQILKSNSHFKRVLPLPSENWSDFADIWFCHNHSHQTVNPEESDTPTSTEHAHVDFSELKSKSLLPRNEDCLVSSLYMLADGSHFKTSSIVSCADRIVCRRCGNFLGFVKEKPNRQQQAHHSHGTFKIYFHAVTFNDDGKEGDSSPKDTLDSFPVNNSHNKDRVEDFMSGLLKDQSRIFTSFRFILSSSLQVNDQSSIVILLWLLDQDLTVFSSYVAKKEWKSTTTSSHPVSPTKYLKVLYKATFHSLKSSHHSSNNQSSDVFQAWRKDNTVHEISLPYPLCKQLIRFLMSSTKQLALSQRSLNGFHVGFLKAS